MTVGGTSEPNSSLASLILVETALCSAMAHDRQTVRQMYTGKRLAETLEALSPHQKDHGRCLFFAARKLFQLLLYLLKENNGLCLQPTFILLAGPLGNPVCA